MINLVISDINPRNSDTVSQDLHILEVLIISTISFGFIS